MGKAIRPYATEAELAAQVVEWLRAQDWEVYQEVQMSYGGAVADIVGLRGSVTYIIETKLTLSLAVMEQAWSWAHRSHTNLVSVAVPANKKHPNGRNFAAQVLSDYGIGVLEAENRAYTEGIRTRSEPIFMRPRWPIREHLHDEQKATLAGSANGGHWTPFRATVNRLAAHVAANPGLLLADALASIEHHYATDKSARACVSRFVSEGVIKSIRLEHDGKRLRVYPVEVPSHG